VYAVDIDYIPVFVKNNPVPANAEPISIPALQFPHISGGQAMYGIQYAVAGCVILLFKEFFRLF